MFSLLLKELTFIFYSIFQIDTCQSGQTRKRQVRRKQKAPKNKPQGHGPQQTPEKVIGLSEPLITDGNEGVSNDQTKVSKCTE